MDVNTIADTVILVCAALTGVLTFIEKSQKIKLNPLSKLFHGDLDKRLDGIEDKIAKIDGKVDKNDISTIRSRISATATLIKNGGNMTYDQYKCIFEDIDTWRKYHITYPDLNGIINASIEIIEEAFKKEKF